MKISDLQKGGLLERGNNRGGLKGRFTWYNFVACDMLNDMSMTRIVSCKSNLQLACDCHVRHEKCCGLLKYVLKPYGNCSDG